MRHCIHLAPATLLVALGCAAAQPRPGGPPAPSRAPGHELFEQGRRAALRGDSLRAEQYLTLAIEEGYPREKTLPLLLRACLDGSRLRAALDHARAHLRERPGAPRLRYLVATLYESLEQRDLAKLELEQLLAEQPDDADAHYLSGVLALESDPGRARDHFLAYLDLAPQGARAAEVRSRLSALSIRAARRAGALR